MKDERLNSTVEWLKEKLIKSLFQFSSFISKRSRTLLVYRRSSIISERPSNLPGFF